MSQATPPLYDSPKDAKAQAKAAKAYQKASRPWFKKKRFILLLILVVIVGIIIANMSGSSSSSTSSSSSGSGSTSDGGSSADGGSSSDSGEAQAAGLNQAVKDGKFEFTVTGQDCSQTTIGASQYAQSTAQGVYCIVSLHVTNIGDEAQYFDASSQKAFDAQQKQYSADSGAAIYLGDANSFLEQLNPGSAVDGQLVYDVPAGTQLTQMELHDSMFSGGVKVNLG
ncbi:DUF4352 domain-containing protein [Modestobacter excelsi]|uniref:DUF4352 domain-containing protein n=1 Tax=Modestobacter excelsi TaxID=2213161 RepID=UPI00110CF8B0|nr:DUF4352 domain-containing protein [Modestobacter excelsi]